LRGTRTEVVPARSLRTTFAKRLRLGGASLRVMDAVPALELASLTVAYLPAKRSLAGDESVTGEMAGGATAGGLSSEGGVDGG
jgi:hypothetical protein